MKQCILTIVGFGWRLNDQLLDAIVVGCKERLASGDLVERGLSGFDGFSRIRERLVPLFV